jgi:hypothetical protein
MTIHNEGGWRWWRSSDKIRLGSDAFGHFPVTTQAVGSLVAAAPNFRIWNRSSWQRVSSETNHMQQIDESRSRQQRQQPELNRRRLPSQFSIPNLLLMLTETDRHREKASSEFTWLYVYVMRLWMQSAWSRSSLASVVDASKCFSFTAFCCGPLADDGRSG